jgi:hypothetical protein
MKDRRKRNASSPFPRLDRHRRGKPLSVGQRVRVVGTKASPAYLRLFDFAAGVFTAGQPIKTNPTQKLPPRALAFY